GGNTTPPSGPEPVERFHPGLAGEFGSLMGRSKMWGQEWKDAIRNTWDSRVGVGIQGESLPYTDQFLDLDPTYKDSFGQPLLRITFDFHDNDYKLYRHLAQKCIEIMRAMNPTD